MSAPVWAPGWVPGQQLTAFSVVTANYTVAVTDRYIEADATAASITLTLPTAVGCAGQTYTFKRIDSVTASNVVTIATTASQTIDGLPSRLLTFQYELLAVLSDGVNWVVIESNYAGKEIAYVETFTPASTNNTASADSTLSATSIPGLSLTVMGAGRPVVIEFLAPACYNSATANTSVNATLLINGVQNNGVTAKISSPETSGTSAFRPLYFKRRIVLTAGTSYTFTIGMWGEASGSAYYAQSNSLAFFPISLAVIGQ